MNIFIEENSPFYDIEEIIDKVRGKVTKILKFRNITEPTLKESQKLNGMKSSGSGIMEFIKNIQEEIVGDDVVFPDGKSALYCWEYMYTMHAICQPSNSKCIYTETIGILKGLLQMHTLQWSKDLPKNAGRSDAYVECFRNCLKLHEQTHENDSIKYGEKYWQDEVVNKLGQNDSCCVTKNCTSKQLACLDSWVTKTNNDMYQCSETNAVNAQNVCESQNQCATK